VKHFLLVLVLCVFVCIAPTANVLEVVQAQEKHFTLDQVMSAPFPSDLVAAPVGGKVAWVQNAKGVRAGMSASAEVVVEQVRNAVTVTSEAVESGPAKTVTVKEEGGKEVQKVVTTGLLGNETTQILSGLKPGEAVVLPELKVATSSGEGAATGGFPGGGAAGGGFPFAGGGFAGARGG